GRGSRSSRSRPGSWAPPRNPHVVSELLARVGVLGSDDAGAARGAVACAAGVREPRLVAAGGVEAVRTDDVTEAGARARRGTAVARREPGGLRVCERVGDEQHAADREPGSELAVDQDADPPRRAEARALGERDDRQV